MKQISPAGLRLTITLTETWPAASVFTRMFLLCAVPFAGVARDTVQGPLLIDGKVNTVLTGARVSNRTGTCITIRNARAVRLEGVEVGPCGGHGIDISSSTGVTVTNSYIHHTVKNGISIFNAQRIDVTRSRFEYNSTGVYAQDSSGITVNRNHFRNVQGPGPRGQFVQFNQVNGPGNRISCNSGENVLEQSAPEDAINLFASHGEPSDPIQVVGNRIQGGGPSAHGGGILLGDGGGAWQIARENILVDPGQYGAAVAGCSSTLSM